MADRDVVFPANPHALYREHGYSPAVRAGGLLFVSGQVGARTDGSPEPELADEVALAFNSLADILKAAECTFDDVVDITLFMIDADAALPFLFEQMEKHFGNGPRPALTATGTIWLSGFRFEIKAVAKLPENGQ